MLVSGCFLWAFIIKKYERFRSWNRLKCEQAQRSSLDPTTNCQCIASVPSRASTVLMVTSRWKLRWLKAVCIFQTRAFNSWLGVPLSQKCIFNCTLADSRRLGIDEYPSKRTNYGSFGFYRAISLQRGQQWRFRDLPLRRQSIFTVAVSWIVLLLHLCMDIFHADAALPIHSVRLLFGHLLVDCFKI